ncbi:MAG: DNA polymerase III subunit delta' [Chloroflexi bacterium]|nr:DNA polymerase III subunit delta' [Chloroflexota bacterium]
MWNVIGHSKAVALLDRARRENRLAHAYLLVGPGGVGKRTMALNLAQALNCTGTESPCGGCRSCQRIKSGKHADVRILSREEPRSEDGSPRKEIGIDAVKHLQNEASLPPFEGRRKVFVIDGADYLSPAAANCLLKTLEEPPAGVVILLLTAREDRLLPTVVSRCQRVELLPLPAALLESLLRERGLSPEQAKVLARLSRGCPGWALTAAASPQFLEQHGRQLDELAGLERAGLDRRFALAARMAGDFSKQREKVEAALELCQGWWRDLLLVKGGLVDYVANVDRLEPLQAGAGAYTEAEIRDAITALREARRQLEWNANPRLVLEALMLAIPTRN